MEASERQVVLILADISGYTRFMVENQLAAVHGQVVITFLIETMLKEVNIPLTLHGIEGDAVFLSASHPGTDEEWKAVLALVRTKLSRFFEVFLEGIVRMAESTPCDCPSCKNVNQLKLKIVVHSGRAVFHTIAGLAQIAGTDVIIVHRLLKNSVRSHEYLLMTDAAYRDLGSAMPGHFVPGEEACEGIGKVKTWVRLMDEDREQARDALYAMPSEELAAQGRGYFWWMLPGLFKAMFAQLRSPSTSASWPSRVAFTLTSMLQAPVFMATMTRAVPRQLLAKRAAREASRESRPSTA